MLFRSCLFCSFFVLTLLPVFCPAEDAAVPVPAKKMALAAMDFEARGISAFEALSLSDRFRSELISTNVFSVMERNQMDVILKEQGFQQSGACSEASCIVEMGQLIAVQRMVAGSVGKVGDIYTVEVKMLDVQSGQIVRTVSEDCKCPIEELLMSTMTRVARRMAGLEVEKQESAIQIQKGNAGLFVKSVPAGGRVYLDGKLQDGKTPLTFNNLLAGKHEVRVDLDTLEATSAVDLADNDIFRLELPLILKMTALEVNTEPGEAEIYLNSAQTLGKRPEHVSPFIYKDIKPGKYTVNLFKPGFRESGNEIEVRPYRKLKLDIKLDPADEALSKEQSKFTARRQHRLASKKYLYVALGLGAASVAAYVYSGSKYDEATRIYNNEYKTALSQKSAMDSRERAETSYSTSGFMANLAAGGGVVAAASLLRFTYLFLF